MASHYPIDPITMFRNLWVHKSLILQLAKRDIEGRYRGSMLGMLWALLNPIIMLGVYTFVFGVVFQARWNRSIANKADFAMILFSGLILFNFFSECVNRAPQMILGNATYVKKVVFPLDALGWISLLASLFHMFMSFVVLLIVHTLMVQTIPWTIVFYPLVLIPLILFTIGLSWFLASLGVFVRDVGQIVVVVTTIMLFMSPIFYPLSSVPQKVQIVLQLNPLSLLIEEGRKVLLWGELPNFLKLGIHFILSFVIAWLGFVWFQKTRKGFADVI